MHRTDVSIDGPNFTNNTVVQNSARTNGGGIHLIMSNAVPGIILANNIIAFCKSGGILNQSNNVVNLINNDVFGNIGYNYYGISPGPQDISVDPMFSNAGSGDFHLNSNSTLNSYCINAGSNTFAGQAGLNQDIDGQPRILQGRVDIGADEVDDTVPPTAAFSDPPDQAPEVPINQTITVTFSENLRQGPYWSTITLKRGNEYIDTTNYIENNILYIDPITNLKHNKTYSVTIPIGSVKDTTDNSLPSTFSFSFTTGN